MEIDPINSHPAESAWTNVFAGINIVHGALLGAIVSHIPWREVELSGVAPLSVLFFLTSIFIVYLSIYRYRTKGKLGAGIARYSYFAVVIALSAPISIVVLERWWLLPFVYCSWLFSTMASKNFLDEIYEHD